MSRSRGWLVGGGFVVGAVGGWLLAQRRFTVHRRDLFSPRPLRRLAALGFLAGQGGIGTARLLRDYLSWEREPRLRRRAETILRRLELHLARTNSGDAASTGAGLAEGAS